MNGLIAHLNVKANTDRERGIPKRGIPDAALSSAGVEGDFNRYRHESNDDTPDQAVLLIALETIDALVADNWPVQPGDLGENFTTQGLDHDQLQPGVRLKVGDEIRLEVSEECQPCRLLAVLEYVGSDRLPDFMKALRGRRGWYARVIEPGQVHAGDSISIEAPA